MSKMPKGYYDLEPQAQYIVLISDDGERVATPISSLDGRLCGQYFVFNNCWNGIRHLVQTRRETAEEKHKALKPHYHDGSGNERLKSLEPHLDTSDWK